MKVRLACAGARGGPDGPQQTGKRAGERREQESRRVEKRPGPVPGASSVEKDLQLPLFHSYTFFQKFQTPGLWLEEDLPPPRLADGKQKSGEQGGHSH